MINFLIHSIRGKFLLAFLIILTFALVFQFVFIGPTLEKRKIKAVQETQKGFTGFLAGEINSRLDDAAHELEKMARLPSIASLDRELMDSTISTIDSSNQFFNYYFIMDRSGAWLSYPTHPELIGAKIPQENMRWVDETFASGKTVFLDVVKSKLGTLVSGFSTPVRNQSGEIVALLRGVFVVSKDTALVKSIENVEKIKGYQAYLVSSNGWLIAHSHQSLNYRDFKSYSMTEYEPVKNVLKGTAGIGTYSFANKLWIATYHLINLTGWGLIVHQPLENISQIAKTEARFIVFVILGCFCFGLLIAVSVVLHALNPLSQLVKDIQSGAVTPVSRYPKDEVRQLALQYSSLYNDLYQSREMIRRSEKDFRTLFNYANDAIYIHDLEGNLLEINQKAEVYTGYSQSELLSMKVTDIDAPQSVHLVHSRIEQISQDQGLLFETEHRTKSGDLVPVEISSRSIEFNDQKAILSIVRDLTERKRIEEQRKKFEEKLIQAQKLESIGTLAGGIAHDFNNLLMAIQGYSSLMSLDLSPGHPHWENLQVIDECIQSATGLTRQLLGIARGGKYEVKPVNINDLLLRSTALFGRSHKEITMHNKTQPIPLIVEVDRNQIEQVILNLFVNSGQAMPDGGEIFVETTAVALDQNYCEPYGVKAGRFARVSVTDTGAGMDEATQQRVFDPFFTTKDLNRGSGLGLASAYGIIQNHGGIITVYSEPGQGSTFNVYLPLSEKEVLQQFYPEMEVVKGTETILLVDDEEMVIDVGQAMLETLGYHVLVSRGGEDAVKTVSLRGNEINLVLLDLIMPVIDGEKAFDAIHRLRPELPVLLSSGFSINGKASEILQKGGSGFIQKPFTITELSRAVRNVLDV